jgi:hypothetical protein
MGPNGSLTGRCHTVLKIKCMKQKSEDPFKAFALDLRRPDASLLTPVITGLNVSQTATVRTANGATGSPLAHSKMTPRELMWFTQVQSRVNQGGATPAELRDATGLGKSTESSIRKRLQGMGYVLDASQGPQPRVMPTKEGTVAVFG